MAQNIRIQFICLLLAGVCGYTHHGYTQTIAGVVLDESNAPLPAVNISIPALHRGTATDINGKFVIDRLKPGVFTVEFSFLGFKKETRSLMIDSSAVHITIRMQQTVLTLPGVVVTGKPQPTDVLTSSQSIRTVEGRELAELRGQNIISTIGNTPGVSTYTTGAGVVKPVIRGLTSQRVLVVSDGTRQEGQQWGDEHSPEIDAFDVERVEVLRGPSSVLYGSDALGGVVNIIKHDLPSTQEGSSKLEGVSTFNGFSNNKSAAGALSLSGASGIMGYRGHFSLRDARDIVTPEGKLFNSGLTETSGGGQVGVRGNWGLAMIDYTDFGQELQIHEDPVEEPGATPFQIIQHQKVHFHGDIPTQEMRLEIDGSWQENDRKEFEVKDAEEPVLHLRLETYSLSAKGHHFPIGPLFGTVGFALMSQRNRTLAEEKLIPGFKLLNLAGFLYEEAQLNKLNLSAGFRYDTQELDVKETPDIGVDSQTRNYHAVTGNMGVVYRLAQPMSLSLNVGKGWRAPSAFELFVDGVHEGTVQYLIGDDDLKTEKSLNVDFSLHYVTSRLQGEWTFFRNSIGDYIFASPTGEIDSESNFMIYQLSQADATLSGAEFSMEAEVSRWLLLNGAFDYVKGTNDQTHNPLPMIPASRMRLGARVRTDSVGGVRNPYVSLGMKAITTQDRIEAFETRTGGYTLLNVGIGGDIILGSKRMNLDLSIENLFNKAYRDHLNRFKTYALNPGRNVTLKVSVPFVLAR